MTIARFDEAEVALMVFIIAGLDSDRYARPRAKSLIYKCKTYAESVREPLDIPAHHMRG